MQRQLAAFVERPSKATFLAARDAVLRRSPLPVTATDLADLERLLDEELYPELLQRLDLLPPSKVLSPRIHFLAAEAAQALGHDADVELERSLFVLSLQGLLATGDGTPASPYIVCHPSDEHDLAEALGTEVARQSLVQRGDRLCDVIICANGRELWFDITDLLRRTTRKPRLARRRALRRSAPARRLRSLRSGG
jgi:hypothetical protein